VIPIPVGIAMSAVSAVELAANLPATGASGGLGRSCSTEPSGPDPRCSAGHIAGVATR
jgi:hypothetical protein